MPVFASNAQMGILSGKIMIKPVISSNIKISAAITPSETRHPSPHRGSSLREVDFHRADVARGARVDALDELRPELDALHRHFRDELLGLVLSCVDGLRDRPAARLEGDVHCAVLEESEARQDIAHGRFLAHEYGAVASMLAHVVLRSAHRRLLF